MGLLHNVAKGEFAERSLYIFAQYPLAVESR